nr:MAG TPA: hypothetical protein [Caudoviricetes sp.]DAS52296.1 MAG TPA: hypothetical protein [Caudoviricetes sp.]
MLFRISSPIFYRGLICVLLNQISLKKECKGFPFTFTLFAVGMTGLWRRKNNSVTI